MLRDDGVVKVLDFGLAKLTAPDPSGAGGIDAAQTASLQTQPGVILGTVRYMSPEQARGQEVDARSDIFSFGVVLYEIFAARPPFEGSGADLLAAILKTQPVPLSRHTPEVPRELERIVAKTMRKERRERYQTVKDLQLDLKSLQQELQIKDTLHEAKHVGIQIKGRRRGIVGAALILVMLAAGATAYRFFFGVRMDSIAILPLVNVTHDANAEYLSDGISEALINSLAELPNLRVVARSTAFRYRGSEVDPQQVGRELRVRAVLTGRVQQAGDALAIQVDLDDANTGAQLWGHEYQSRIFDMLSVKQEIARQVAERLRFRLSGEDRQRLVRHDTANGEAYQFYLRGQYLQNKRTEEGFRKAMQQFQQAIECDPSYALAYLGIANCYLFLDQYGDVPESETLPKAKAAIDRALQIDDSLAEAHTSLGLLNLELWRWADSDLELHRAISLNPNYPTAH